jgi:hypothetical protein
VFLNYESLLDMVSAALVGVKRTRLGSFRTRRAGRSPRMFLGMHDQLSCVFQDYCCVGCLKSKTSQFFEGKSNSSVMQLHRSEKKVLWFNSGLDRDDEIYILLHTQSYRRFRLYSIYNDNLALWEHKQYQ